MRRRAVRHLHARNDYGDACHLLNKNPNPTMEEIREGLSGNLVAAPVNVRFWKP